MQLFEIFGDIVLRDNNVNRQLDRVEDSARETTSVFERLGERASAVGDKMKGMGETMSAAVTLPLAAIGTLAIKAADDWVKANGMIKAQTGATAAEAEKLTGIAKELWLDAYGENAEDAANAVSTVRRNIKELNNEQLKDVAEQAFILNDAFEADINDSTKTASTLMKNFGIDAEHAMDLMTVGFQKGGDFSGELLDTMNEYSPVFASMGLSADDMLNTLIKGAQAGAFNLDKVGDAVKEFNIRAKDGSDATIEGFQAIGLNAEEMGAAIAEGGEKGKAAFNATILALSQMKDPMERNAAGVALFGTQWEDLEANVILAMDTTKNELGEVEGAAKRAGEALYKDLGTALTTAWRNVQTALEPAGLILSDMIKQYLPVFIEKIQKVTQWFENLSPKAQKLTVIFGLIAAAIGPVLVVVGGLIAGFGAFATAIAGVSLPVIGIIAGIVALGVALVTAYMKSENFRNKVNAAFSKIKEIALQVFGIVASFIKSKVSEISAWWQKDGEKIRLAAEKVFKFIQTIVQTVMPIVLAVIKSAWGNIKGVINGAIKIITAAISIFASVITGDFSGMWENIKKLFGGAVEFVWNLLNLLFIGRILKGVKTLATSFISTVKGFLTNARTNFQLFKDTAETTFKQFFANIIKGAVNFIKGVISYFKNMLEQAKTIYSMLRQFGESAFKALFNTIRSVVSNIYNAIKTNFSNAYNAVKTVVGNIKSSISTGFSNALSTARTTFNNIKNAIMNPIETAKNKITGWIGDIKSAFSNFATKIKVPHFKVSNFSLNPKDWIANGLPSISVDWYKDGGLFPANSPRIVGVGDAKVPEAAIPLKDSVLSMIGDRIAAVMPQGTGSNQPINITVVTELDGYEVARNQINYINEMQGNQIAAKSFVKGVK